VFSVTKKTFDNRTRGLEGEGFVSGLLKMGIEGGGFFNVSVSKIVRTLMGISTFDPAG